MTVANIIERELSAAKQMNDVLLHRQTVQAMFAVGTTRFYELLAAGVIPQPVRSLGKRLVRWRAGEVKAALAAQTCMASTPMS